MAKRKKEEQKGFGKLLEAWTPPTDAGARIGCAATSFTFSSAFFEEECLSRFLALETDPTEDGPLYLIEREDKLSSIECACAIVDQHYCKGPRSLRWDLLPARLSRGILHAKMSLLVWSNLVRLVITSANLTEDGYRRNLEVFGIFDYREGGQLPSRVLYDAVDFLRLCANHSQMETQPASQPLNRIHALLDRVARTPVSWGQSDEEGLRKGATAYLVTVQPDRPHALDSLVRLWPGYAPPTDAHVVSPFFDPPESPNRPARELWQRMRKRGSAQVSFYLEKSNTHDEKVHVHAPESLLHVQPSGRPGVETHIRGIDLDAMRSLHAKEITLHDDRWCLHMIGSSNFTSAGLGIPTARNLEANVAFLVDSKKQPKTAEALRYSLPPSVALKRDDIQWLTSVQNEDEAAADLLPLPEAFVAATYMNDEKECAHVVLSIAGDPPSGWAVFSEHDEPLLTERNWADSKPSGTSTIDWVPVRPPSGFWVSWEGTNGRAWWPVNVESSRSLPPPDELKSLSLDILIDILSSARPLYRVLGDYLKRQHGNGLTLPSPELVDPHKRVDTSQFLLQRTRRVSWALCALRERLERPVATEEGLNWRLYGPVGVRAVMTALLKEGHSPEEKAFLLSELALELARVRPLSAPGCLPGERIKDAIREMIAELREATTTNLDGGMSNLNTYVREVFEAVLA